ncbi:MAG: DegT/DnrJ/EryC1/StrS family aminotransferase [Methanomassiliicoccales archaeon]|jgi:dTDP-4-amino-4,6-dideoxygalactose transaminase
MITVTKSDLPPIEDYIRYLERIWSTHWLTNDGELCQLLRKRLEEYLRIKNLVLLSNGTLALQLALKAMDIKGEVITTPFTFAATTNSIVYEGARPVFADIDSETYNLDPEDVEKKITDETEAIMAVHVYGNPCDVERLGRIAKRNDLVLIYDAAHAFGVEYAGQSVLEFGDVSTLSFHATKVFNTIEGGAIVAADDAVVDKLRLLRNHGIRSETEVVLPGTNAKMNEFQAAMGLCNLERIDKSIESRKRIYDYYRKNLPSGSLRFQRLTASRYNYIYMPVCFKNNYLRDRAYSELLKNGIRSRKYFFPLTVHFDYLREKEPDSVGRYGLHRASDISGKVLCLPLYQDLSMNDVDRIIEIVKGIF